MSTTYICRQCGHAAEPVTTVPGSARTEILLWLLLIIPGLAYTIWRSASRRRTCSKCGGTKVVPIDSHSGQQIAQTFGLGTRGAEQCEKE